MSAQEIAEYPYPGSIDYQQAGDHACYSAAVAYLMFRLNAPDELWHPRAIDKITGRQSGEPTQDMQVGLLALLEQGATLTEISDFDRERFQEQGLGYLTEYCVGHPFLEDDPEAFYATWTPERIETHQAREKRFSDNLEKFGGSWKRESRRPTHDDVTVNVTADQVVLTKVRTNVPGLLHVMVVLDYIEASETGDEDTLIVFDNRQVPPIRTVKAEWFRNRLFIPHEGLVVVENLKTEEL